MNPHKHFFSFRFALWMLLLFSSGYLYASQYLPPALDSLVLQGKNEIYNLHLPEARHIFQQIRETYPDYPHGYVYEAYVTMLLFGMDLSNDSLGKVLENQINIAKKVVKAYREQYPDQAESYFMAGLANGIIGIKHVVNRSYVKGYFSGKRAKGNLEKTVKLDSTYYDAYLGLGIFHYYADLLPGVLKFFARLLGFGGNREQGIHEILLSSQRGKYFKVEGEFIYYSARYFLEGERRQSFRGIQDLYRRYPDNDAFGLMIAYHYRRIGYLRKCIEYCQRIHAEADFPAPQIPNLKYYNMAVSYYDLNQFEIADSLFDLLDRMPTRKSMYYQAGINFYKGHLADLRLDHETALRFYNKIPKHKQTQYWYQLVRSLKKYPTDSLMVRYFIARNLLYSRQFDAGLKAVQKLIAEVRDGAHSNNPDFPYLVSDLLGENYYYTGRKGEARKVYAELIPGLNKMEDDFRRAWIYIHYGRALRDLGYYDLAKKMFNKANDVDEDYTRLIVSREKYVLKKMVTRTQKS